MREPNDRYGWPAARMRGRLKYLASRDVRRPSYSLTARDDVLHFSDICDLGPCNVDTKIPASVRRLNETPTVAHSLAFSAHAGRDTFFKLTSTQNPAFDAGSPDFAISYGCLKADLNDTQFIVGTFGFSSCPFVQRFNLLTHALEYTSAEISARPLQTTHTRVVRIEAVCELDGTQALMAIGIHDIPGKLSTIEFWVVGPTQCYQLDTVIQVVMPDGENWDAYDAGARYCAHVYVIDNGNGYTIVANDLATGRAVQFRWNDKAGIESQIQQVVQIDADASTVTFMPTGLTKINALYYLSGLFRRPMTDGTADLYSVYLTSADAWNWSVGERSSFIAGGNVLAQLVPHSYPPNIIYAFGYQDNGHARLYGATARKIDNNGMETGLRFVRWTLDTATDSGDQFSVDVPPDSGIKEGQNLTFEAGWIDDDGAPIRVKLGEYIVTLSPDEVTPDGPQLVTLSAIDAADQIQNEWKASVDVVQYSRTMHQDAMDDLGKLIAKTVIRDAKIKSQSDPENTAKAVTISDGALYSDALNDPFVGYSTDRDERDGVFYAEVEFQNTSGKCQQSFGFVFGGDSGQFNAVVIPAESTWTGHEFASAGPQVMISRLPPNNPDTTKNEWLETSDPAPDVVKNGCNWNTPQRLIGLVESANVDDIARPTLLVPATALNAAAYRPSGASAFSPGVKYQAALRRSGRRLQVYIKTRDYAPAHCNDTCAWTMAAEFRLDDSMRHAFSDRPYQGVCLSTDVWASRNAFQQAAYGDIDLGLSAAWNNYPPATTLVGTLSRTRNNADEDPGPDGQHRAFHWRFDGAVPASLWVGRFFYLYWTGDLDPGWARHGMWCYIHHIISGNEVYIATTGTPGDHSWDTGSTLVDGPYTNYFPRPNSSTVQAWLSAAQPEWGGAASGFESTNGNLQNGAGVSVVNGDGAEIAAIQVKGSAMFIDDGGSSSAISIRKVSTNNRIHTLLSGSDGAGGTGLAWDTTNPIAEPRTWSIKLNHGVFFEHLPGYYNLDDEGFFRVEDEYIRYRGEEFSQTGIGQTTKWCSIPTFYAVAKTASKPAIIEHWNVFGDPIPGGFTQFPTPKGMLVEIRSRSGNSNIIADATRVYRVKDTHDRDYSTAGGHVPHESQLELDQQYDGDITAPLITGSKTAAADIIIWSGRGQMKSDKALHDATATVALYPMQLTNPPPADPYPWLIRVDAYDQFQGLYTSIEDDLKSTCALAGIRNVHFRSLGRHMGSLDVAPVVLASNVSNFVLDIKAHLFGQPDNRLKVTFRNGNYVLDLKHVVDATHLASGRMGDLEYRLHAPKSTIVQGAHEAKFLERNVVSISDHDLSGAYDGTNHSEDVAKQIAIRLAVRDNLISIEIEGQHVWTINLDRFDYTDEAGVHQNYKTLEAGDVVIQYTDPDWFPQVDARLQELSGEIEFHIIDMNQSCGDALGFLLEGRHIWSRAEPDRGILFTNNLTRENWSADGVELARNKTQDTQVQTSMEIAGHAVVSGAEFGEAFDEGWIREHGYLFEMASNRLLNTVQDSRTEAQILLRVAREHSATRGLTGPALLDLQPLDRLEVSRPATGDIKATAKTAYIVRSMHFEGDANGIHGTLDTFKEMA